MVRVNDNGGTRVVTGLSPAKYDVVDITYPSSTTEVYTFSIYQEDNTTTTVIAQIKITYTDSNKNDLLRVERII